MSFEKKVKEILLQNLLLCRKTTLSDFDKSEDGDF
jgi:hypothetical protein